MARTSAWRSCTTSWTPTTRGTWTSCPGARRWALVALNRAGMARLQTFGPDGGSAISQAGWKDVVLLRCLVQRPCRAALPDPAGRPAVCQVAKGFVLSEYLRVPHPAMHTCWQGAELGEVISSSSSSTVDAPAADWPRALLHGNVGVHSRVGNPLSSRQAHQAGLADCSACTAHRAVTTGDADGTMTISHTHTSL